MHVHYEINEPSNRCFIIELVSHTTKEDRLPSEGLGVLEIVAAFTRPYAIVPYMYNSTCERQRRKNQME